MNPAEYWNHRYNSGGNSGPGSYGRLAEFKAEVLNGFVAERGITSVIEFGCGDGHQLALAKYPSYVGFDISDAAVGRCRRIFSGDDSKRFYMMAAWECRHTAELALSLDVIYHLVDDADFAEYMATLFAAAERFVIIYSSNYDQVQNHPCLLSRCFTPWIEQNIAGWKLAKHIPNRYPFVKDEFNESDADFFIYEHAN